MSLLQVTSLDLALSPKAKALPGIELEQVEGFLRALRDVLNKITDHFWHVEDSFIIYADRDAEYLVSWLRRAVAKKKTSPFNLIDSPFSLLKYPHVPLRNLRFRKP